MFRARTAGFIGVPFCALVAYLVWLAKAESPPQTAPTPNAIGSPLKFLKEDKLTDFVVESEKWFGRPTTQDELDRALQSGKAMRASDFFSRRDFLPKPFYGELPTHLCNLASNQLQVRKDFSWVNVQLETPKQPEIFIVSAGSPDNARRTVYDHEPPISYHQDPYWAVIYVGSSSSTPTSFVMDRATIKPESTEILLHCPAYGARTKDLHPYWFCVPLGHLPDGPYSVKVRITNRDEPIATAKVTLRHATTIEEAAQNKALGNDQEIASRHFDKLKDDEHEQGAALQVSLERLAEFVHSANVSDEGRSLLASDIEQLGKAVRWDSMGIYGKPSDSHRDLADPTPGEIPDLKVRRNSFDKDPEWQPSNIPLSDIWLCDGTDADWYASATYRNVRALNGALTAENPPPVQQKIARIWAALQQKGADRNGMLYSAFPAAGTIEDAIDTTHDVLVNGKTPIKKFSSTDQMWAVFMARRSFLIRAISTRTLEDEIDHSKRTEFFVHTTAYIGNADDIQEPAPVTFALIPLGQSKGVQSVGAIYGCQSICGKPLTAGAEPLYARPPEQVLTDYARCLPIGTGFQVTP